MSYDVKGKRTGEYIQNLSCSAVIYLYKGRIFVQFFGLPRRFKIPMRGLKDFHYQNQTDEPKDVTRKEWAERKRIWNAMLVGKPDGRPNRNGLIFEFVEANDYMYLTFAVFEKKHGHRMWADDGGKDCEICKEKRAAYEKEQAAKKEGKPA
jgi:hypothetical protein